MSYDPSANKIDGEATLGLAGVNNSLAYRVHEIEKHFHNRATWWEKATSTTMRYAGTDVQNFNEWTATASATPGTYGSVVQICDGTEIDAFFTAAYVKWDLHSIVITSSNAGNTKTNYLLQFGTSAATWDESTIITEIPLTFYANTDRAGKKEIVCPRLATNQAVFCRLKSNINAANITFIIGIHCYLG